MSLQITDDNWSLKVNTYVDSNVDKYNLGTFINPFVIILIESVTANPVWNEAGKISEAITFDGQLAYGSQQELFLKQLNLRHFTALSGNNYQLYYFPLVRLESVRVKVWEYQGTTKDVDIENLINSLQTNNKLIVDLSSIETKLNAICQHLGINCNPREATAEEVMFFLFN